MNCHFYPCLATVALLLVLLDAPFSVRLVRIAYAGTTLPPTIHNGSYYSTNDSIPSGTGTTLNVPNMLSNAANSNLSAAVFEATNTTFDGPLTITLPTTAAAWTTSNIIPLHVLIKDGISGVSPLTTNIVVTGILSLGSSIFVQGGSFVLTSYFMQFASGITIQDDATFVVEGGTHLIPHPPSSGDMYLVQCATKLDIHNNGTLSIAHNDLIVSNVIVDGGLVMWLLHAPTTVISITTNSTLSIIYNTILTRNVSVGLEWNCFCCMFTSAALSIISNGTLYVSNNKVVGQDIVTKTAHIGIVRQASGSRALTISEGSNFIVHNNTLDTYNVTTDAGGMHIYILLMIYSSIVITTNSTFSVIYNNMSLVDVVVPSCQGHTAYLPSSYSLGANSTLSISNNYMGILKTVGITTWECRVYRGSAPTISSSSTFSLFNNTMEMRSVTMGAGFLGIVLWIGGSPASISTNSKAIVNKNSFLAANFSMSTGYMFYTFYDYTSITIDANSDLSIFDNTMHHSNITAGTMWDVYMTYLVSKAFIDTSSALSVSYNNMAAVDARVNSGNWKMYMFTASATDAMQLGTDGAFNVMGNKLEVHTNHGTIPPTPVLVYVLGQLRLGTGAETRIVKNYINADGVDNCIGEVMRTEGTNAVLINSYGSLFVKENVVIATTGLGYVFNIKSINTAPTSTPCIHTCHNIVNNASCIVDDAVGGVYSCSRGTSLVGYLDECNITSVTSTPFQRTPTPTPKVAEPSRTPSTTHQRTSVTAYSPTILLSLPSRTESPLPLISSSSTASPARATTTPSHYITPTSSKLTPTTNAVVPTSTQSSTFTVPFTASPPPRATTNQPNPPVSSPCPSSTHTPCHYADTIITNNFTTNTTICDSSGRLPITIPYTVWSGSSPRLNLSMRLAQGFAPHHIDNTSVIQAISTSSPGLLEITSTSASHLTNATTLWATLQVAYIGPTFSSSTRYVLVDMILPAGSYSCSFPPGSGGGGRVSLKMILDPIPTIPEAVNIVIDSAVVVAVVSGVPSSIVRASIINSVIQMLQCSEFDPDEEVDFINNPLGWAIGRPELQYHRGSVVTALIVMSIAGVFLTLLLVAIRVCGTGVRSWGAALETLRLPSLPLVFVLLLGEGCVSSTVALMFSDVSEAADIILAFVAMMAVIGYTGLYVYQTAVSNKYTKVVEVPVKRGQRSIPSRLLVYLMEPTHEVVLPTYNESTNGHSDEVNEGWLRGNYYFVAERRWAQFGAIEVVGGTLTNMLEGAPLATTSRTLCIARPVCVMLITAVLLVLLVWKVPNAVRLQHWCSLFVMSGMLLASTIASVNAASPSEHLEVTTGYVGLVVVGASMVLGIIDFVMMLFAYIPTLRTKLSFRSRGLASTIQHSHERQQSADQFGVPMLVVATSDDHASAASPPIQGYQTNPSDNSTSAQQRPSTSTNTTPPTQHTPLGSNGTNTPTNNALPPPKEVEITQQMFAEL